MILLGRKQLEVLHDLKSPALAGFMRACGAVLKVVVQEKA